MEDHRIDFEKNRTILRKLLLRHLPAEGTFSTFVNGFTLHRYDRRDTSISHFYEPTFIVAVQGRKWVRIGTENLSFGGHTCFISGVNMPVSSCILEASENMPYLSMSLKLDKTLLATLATQESSFRDHRTNFALGAAVQAVTPQLLDAFLRLIELIEIPEQIPVMGALICQEIHYRLLISPFGYHLRRLNTLGFQSNQVNQAISWLKENYKKPLQVDKLAERVNMAPSTFHKYFKKITAISPLQYQKRLRLSEAQHLMLNDNYEVAQAAFAVGYESDTQFSREYKRLYGLSPHKDIIRMKLKNG